MAYCPHCKEDKPGNPRFCPDCGARLEPAPLIEEHKGDTGLDRSARQAQSQTVVVSPSDAIPRDYCPICGLYVRLDTTFRCSRCRRAGICLDHRDPERKICSECGDDIRREAEEQARRAAEVKARRQAAHQAHQQAKAAYESGLDHHRKGDYDHAVADKTRAIELDPTSARYYNSRGVSLHARGDYDRAIADKTRAIEMQPAVAEYYRSRGVTHRLKGDYDLAIADFSRAIELDPDNGLHYQSRGLAYRAKGDTRRADADFGRARELGY